MFRKIGHWPLCSFSCPPPSAYQRGHLIQGSSPPCTPRHTNWLLGNGEILSYLKFVATVSHLYSRVPVVLKPVLNKVKRCCFFQILSSVWSWSNLTFTFYSSTHGPFPLARMVSPLSPINHYHLWLSALAYPVFSALTFLFFIPYLPKAPILGSCSRPAVSR